MKPLKTTSSSIHIDGSFVKRRIHAENKELCLEEEIEFRECMTDIMDKKSFYLLSDFSLVRSVTGEALKYRNERKKNLLAQAFVANNPLSRAIVNFVIYVENPTYPVRVFTNMDRARRWLALQEKKMNRKGHILHNRPEKLAG